MPPDGQLELGVVLGSVTPPGRLHLALAGAIDRARGRGVEADLIDLARYRVSFADGRSAGELGDDTETVVTAVEAAAALIFATPVYRGSMTGSLKNLIDQLPVPALRGKAVGIVAMGASDHHFLGAERHLRDVLAFFGAFTIPVAVYLSSRDFDAGAPPPAAEALLDQLFAATAAAATATATAADLGPPPLGEAARPSSAALPDPTVSPPETTKECN